ncbi:site-specific tyrosine recombinase/integron integrase [uncultured Tenacibaculum sp.]|uniref:site-specific tyrosine recombinase/integron integrase n=1 Tax=uncultured Tenacibaculum sp. TaxID=174713 RepID=UPI00262CB2F1|nr:site-specific tyrosine recombinase/integron integrase [uncultured Tenacibaculum sp.]
MKIKTIVILRGITHKNKSQIAIQFPYDAKIINLIKTIKGATWSRSLKTWYLLQSKNNLNTLIKLLRENNISVRNLIQPLHQSKKTDKTIPETFERTLKRKRYSKNTIKVYTSFLQQFINFLDPKTIEEASDNDVRNFQDYLINKRKVAISTQNQAINAIKFYFEQILQKDRKTYYIERPKKPKQLPKILSENQIFNILKHSDNLKHKFILALLYSSGLRISELLSLRKEDVLYDKNLIFVRSGKGNKDRTTIFAEHMKKLHKLYINEYKPNYWLIEGLNRKQYSSSSVAKILKRAALKAGISQNVTPHMLRHSFATHMLEQGIDLRYIQNILGHGSSKTTEIYTRVTSKSLAKIKSPLDTFLDNKTI